MTDEACFYTLMRSPKENHERLLRELVAPVAREIREHPDLDSFFFVRYNDPEWQIRFRILGRPRWIDSEIRERVAAALRPMLDSGLVQSVEFGEYLREWDRYGGPEGMALAEKLFLHDSAACLDLIESESRGELARSRREYSLVHTERFLDLMEFDIAKRREFYRFGFKWTLEEKHWSDEDMRRLDLQYSKLRSGIHDLLVGVQSRTAEVQYGGAEPARISRTCLEATRPIVERLRAAHADGAIGQDLVPLAWSYSHMHCNRLGIDTIPEAILRYFMFRFYEEPDGEGPSNWTRNSVA